MSGMSVQLTRGILGMPLMLSYMARLKANGWETIVVGHNTK